MAPEPIIWPKPKWDVERNPGLLTPRAALLCHPHPPSHTHLPPALPQAQVGTADGATPGTHGHLFDVSLAPSEPVAGHVMPGVPGGTPAVSQGASVPLRYGPGSRSGARSGAWAARAKQVTAFQCRVWRRFHG